MAENQSKSPRAKFAARRTLLLTEIERYCRQQDCRHLNRVGLTKNEALLYTGFKCEKCEVFQADVLQERDIPEWWEELMITDMTALRGSGNSSSDENSIVNQLSDTYRKDSNGDDF